MKEYVRKVKLINSDIRDCRLYVYFNDDLCVCELESEIVKVNVTGPNFTSALRFLLEKLGDGNTLSWDSGVVISSDDTRWCAVNLDISLQNVNFEQYIKFDLSLRIGEEIYKEYSYEDFGIALRKIHDKVSSPFQCCSFCKYGDFKSDGNEDLLEGWFCFRELAFEVDMALPWFERLTYFDSAIPNNSAFHWCPKFEYQHKVFA